MKDSAEQIPFEELMARALLNPPNLESRPENSPKGTRDLQILPKPQSADSRVSQPRALEPKKHGPQPPEGADFIKVETNLSGIGFFTPSSKRVKKEQKKVTRISREVDGERVNYTATIHAIPEFGLPITADLDKYLALMKLINDLQLREGTITNPITFTSAQLLRVLEQSRDSGKNYKAVSDWLDVMSGTLIVSERVVHFAGERGNRRGRFHVFAQAISAGQVLPNGTTADRHYIWLSDWQLNNINHHYQLPVDFKTYRRLKTNIAKTLVPWLQRNLYATGHVGVYRKRYADLCEHLNIRQYRAPSDIKRKLGAALDELTAHGYLARWELERTQDRREYIVVFYHGEKFRKDRQLQEDRAAGRVPAEGSEVILTSSESSENPPEQAFDPELLAALTTRGIRPKQARQALLAAEPDQDVLGQLEYADQVVAESADEIKNPPGFYLSLIRENFKPPTSFETSSQRAERERLASDAADDRARQSKLRAAYQRYQQTQAETHMTGLPAGEHDRIRAAKRTELLEQYPKLVKQMGESGLTRIVESGIAADVIKALDLLNFSEFYEQQNDATGST